VSPLRAADDAAVIDTTNLDVDAIVGDIIHRVHAAEAH
jgi:cytidylate kinase